MKHDRYIQFPGNNNSEVTQECSTEYYQKYQDLKTFLDEFRSVDKITDQYEYYLNTLAAFQKELVELEKNGHLGKKIVNTNFGLQLRKDSGRNKMKEWLKDFKTAGIILLIGLGPFIIVFSGSWFLTEKDRIVISETKCYPIKVEERIHLDKLNQSQQLKRYIDFNCDNTIVSKNISEVPQALKNNSKTLYLQYTESGLWFFRGPDSFFTVVIK